MNEWLQVHGLLASVRMEGQGAVWQYPKHIEIRFTELVHAGFLWMLLLDLVSLL